VPKKKKPPFRTLDCETDPFHHCQDRACPKCHGLGRVPQPFVWGLYEGLRQNYEEFTDGEALIDRLQALGGVVYAHNGGKFDYHYLRDHINSDSPLLIINGRLAKFRIGRTEFRDSLNIFPNTRLSDFDDAYGKKIEIDYTKLEPENRQLHAAEISAYLRNDCVRLWEIVKKYWDSYGKSLTQASSSMRYFEKMYDIEAPRQTKTQYDRYRPYYYGGRVQCFVSGVAQQKFSVADINSAYPFAMLRAHPFSPAAILEKHLPPEPEIFKCLIRLSCTSRGAFPWRDPETKELYFPDDEAGERARVREYTITGWEFLTALELDAVKNITIKEIHRFTQTMDFREYIEHFFAAREECRKKGDVAGRIFGKYFMNSLYGKFGANCEKYQEYVIATDVSREKWQLKGYQIYKPWGDRYLMTRAPDAEQLNDLSNRKWRYYNVATAASVTGFVRAYLFRALSKCSRPIYCDTDSVAAADVTALDFGTQLGQWKHEGNFDSYAIAGKKLYAFHVEGADRDYIPSASEKDRSWKIASKGVNFAALENGPALITEIAEGQGVTTYPQVPTYSVTRNAPRFINREIFRTAKNISVAPEFDL